MYARIVLCTASLKLVPWLVLPIVHAHRIALLCKVLLKHTARAESMRALKAME